MYNKWHLFIKLKLFIFFPLIIYSQADHIFVDGCFNDWQELSPLHIDSYEDQQRGILDFGKLWIANDEQYLFLRLEIEEELNLQELNDITLFLDTDVNSSTGSQIHGIGAELEWVFGQRNGVFAGGDNPVNVYHNDIGIVTSPTVSSDEFEIALERNARPDGQHMLFSGDSIRIVLKDNGQGNDRLPDESGGLLYVFDDSTSLPMLKPISIGNKDNSDFRILTYNVYTDNFFEPSLVPSYTRILKAIQPQIIGFQEIYHHGALQTQNQVESMLPSKEGEQWYSSKVEPDIIALSRYPILKSYPIEGESTSSFNGAFLIDLHPDFDSHLLFIVAHLPAGSNNRDRQYEIDAIMAFIRSAMLPDGVLTLEPNTPFVIVGDMNLVGYNQQLTSLLTGQIINNSQFGPSFNPDWDNSDFTDLIPRHVDLPMFYTWYNETSSWLPGRLDFIIYSDSVIDPVHSFVLFTPSMSTDSLTAYNLQQQDAILASDHLPVVADFVLNKNSNEVEPFQNDIPHKFKLYQNFPNPFNPTTTIEYSLSENSNVNLLVYDLKGNVINKLHFNNQDVGCYSVTWDGSNTSGNKVSTGIYFYRMIVGHYMKTKKMFLMK